MIEPRSLEMTFVLTHTLCPSRLASMDDCMIQIQLKQTEILAELHVLEHGDASNRRNSESHQLLLKLQTRSTISLVYSVEADYLIDQVVPRGPNRFEGRVRRLRLLTPPGLKSCPNTNLGHKCTSDVPMHS